MRKIWLLLSALLCLPVTALAGDNEGDMPELIFWDLDAGSAYDFKITELDIYADIGLPDISQAFCPSTLAVYPKTDQANPLQTLSLTIGLAVDNETLYAYYDGDSIKFRFCDGVQNFGANHGLYSAKDV